MLSRKRVRKLWTKPLLCIPHGWDSEGPICKQYFWEIPANINAFLQTEMPPNDTLHRTIYSEEAPSSFGFGNVTGHCHLNGWRKQTENASQSFNCHCTGGEVGGNNELYFHDQY